MALRWLDAPEWLDALEWALGAAAIGMDAPGMAALGTAATGAVVTGMAAIGTTGTAIGIITIMSSLLVISAFQGGGAGAGAEAGDIHMDITAMAIRTATVVTVTAEGTATVVMVMAEAMDTVTTDTVTAMGMATVLAANTALPLGRKWPSYNGDSPVPAIIADQSMESWGRKRAGQFELTSRTTVTLTQADPIPPADSQQASC
jgi:hypothetical protein